MLFSCDLTISDPTIDCFSLCICTNSCGLIRTCTRRKKNHRVVVVLGIIHGGSGRGLTGTQRQRWLVRGALRCGSLQACVIFQRRRRIAQRRGLQQCGGRRLRDLARRQHGRDGPARTAAARRPKRYVAQRGLQCAAPRRRATRQGAVGAEMGPQGCAAGCGATAWQRRPAARRGAKTGARLLLLVGRLAPGAARGPVPTQGEATPIPARRHAVLRTAVRLPCAMVAGRGCTTRSGG